MKAVFEYWPVLAQGLWVTVWVSVCIILGAALGAVVLGALRLSEIWLIRASSMLFIECVRGPSALALLFWVFYVLPTFGGMPRLSPLTAAILVLALDGAAYGAEIVRAGIEAVHRGQTDACHALGLSKWRSFTNVILPQALSQIVPAFGSLARSMIKWTALVGFIGVQDVLYVGNFVRGQTFEIFTVYSLLAALYWILTVLCGAGFRAIERVLPLNQALRAARSSVQATPGTDPLARAVQ
ncbi:amino acid ABC transporter permease [Bradyrhizobium sp. CCBAU 51753]|uniref:amino acid ABC transporter permease n=1 Tax=Bradyrhizobium sp. CCBAU 51753 TaxID=1325100 RepID=UPI00188DC2EB|nr:amino acid ABC transporter permease [Bradyrhizobium sp. CCBAU 51753]QOZ23902.1 ectoine/hydroxyectoine ABC transporter permease subunit EhuC [Bradyrhizobium sp. CCBAU 51753]